MKLTARRKSWPNLTVPGLSNNQVNRIRYQAGRFVAIGNAGNISTSIDNVATWQANASGVDGINLRDATYGAGKWVTVGSNGVILTATEDAAVQVVPMSIFRRQFGWTGQRSLARVIRCNLPWTFKRGSPSAHRSPGTGTRSCSTIHKTQRNGSTE